MHGRTNAQMHAHTHTHTHYSSREYIFELQFDKALLLQKLIFFVLSRLIPHLLWKAFLLSPTASPTTLQVQETPSPSNQACTHSWVGSKTKYMLTLILHPPLFYVLPLNLTKHRTTDRMFLYCVLQPEWLSTIWNTTKKSGNKLWARSHICYIIHSEQL